MRAAGRGQYDREKPAALRREEQRLRLLNAASAVIAARGWSRATVEQVVERAGMSRRTFYEHFRDLPDALLQLHDEAASTAFRFVEEAVRAAPDPLARLTAGVTTFFAMLAEHGDLARVIFREVRAAGPEHAVRREAVLGRFVSLLGEGIAEAHAQGVASRAPDELTIYALVCAMEAIGMRYVERREEARAVEAAPAMVELVLRAFV